jgi:hypothetical protein
MQPVRDTDEKGDNGVSIQDSSLSPGRRDSVNSVEAAQEDPTTKTLTRNLILKLDTRCIFLNTLSKFDTAN